MPEKDKQSAETSPDGKESLGIIDDIKKTIAEIRNGIRDSISSVFGGLGVLLKKGFNKLLGKKEEPAADEATPENPAEKSEQSTPSEEKEKPSNESNEKVKALKAKIESLQKCLDSDKDEHKEPVKALEEAQKELEKDNPDMEKIAEKLNKTAEQLFELIKSDKLNIKKGDITEQKTYAIVNAANTELTLGGGVAGAIKEKGGEKVVEACKKAISEGKIPVGEVVITEGGNLKQKIIHAPVMDLGEKSSPENIRKATTAIIKKAAKEGIKTLTIPALGAGAGGVSAEDSAKAMMVGLADALEDLLKMKSVTIILHDNEKMKTFEKEFDLMKKAKEKKVGSQSGSQPNSPSETETQQAA